MSVAEHDGQRRALANDMERRSYGVGVNTRNCRTWAVPCQIVLRSKSAPTSTRKSAKLRQALRCCVSDELVNFARARHYSESTSYNEVSRFLEAVSVRLCLPPKIAEHGVTYHGFHTPYSSFKRPLKNCIARPEK